MTSLSDVRHPVQLAMWSTWRDWRLAYEGGVDFRDEYLKRHRRESTRDFTERAAISYVPAFAKACIKEIRNAVYSRLKDVARDGGPLSYRAACVGELGGVDETDESMSGFVGRFVLPELLAMGRVGVLVDRDPIPEGATLADSVGHPYLCAYKVEDIRSWRYLEGGQQGEFESVLLRHVDYGLDERTGLPNGVERETFKWFRLTSPGEVSVTTELPDGATVDQILRLDRVPFVMMEIEHSLMEDIWTYQVALLNMASGDVSFATRANFPLYTEQFDPRVVSQHLRPGQAGPKALPDGSSVPAGQAAQAAEAKQDEVVVGVGSGRRYPKDTERPGFVSPSSEPLLASIQKQQQMKEEMRALVHLSVATLDPNRASAESKAADDRGLHHGLLAIASTLEQGERQIGRIWADYERSDAPSVQYPTIWTMQSDAERRIEAAELKKQLGTVPSERCQKEIAKRVADLLVGHRTSPEVVAAIHAEIDAADAVTWDPEQMLLDVEKGLLSTRTASKFRLYAPGEVERAKIEHADRLARIAASQSSGVPRPGARGIADAAASADEAREERAEAVASDRQDVPEDPTRGPARG